MLIHKHHLLKLQNILIICSYNQQKLVMLQILHQCYQFLLNYNKMEMLVQIILLELDNYLIILEKNYKLLFQNWQTVKILKLKYSKQEKIEFKMLLHFLLMFKDNLLLILLNFKLPSQKKKILLIQLLVKELEIKIFLIMLVICVVHSILNIVTVLVQEERKLNS